MRQVEEQETDLKYIPFQQDHLRRGTMGFKEVTNAAAPSSSIHYVARDIAQPPPPPLLLQRKNSLEYYSRSWSFTHGQGRKTVLSADCFRSESLLLLVVLTAMLLLLPLLLPPLPPPPLMLLMLPICILLLLLMLAFMPSSASKNRKHL